MSLLLDALKKAAKDKQEAASGSAPVEDAEEKSGHDTGERESAEVELELTLEDDLSLEQVGTEAAEERVGTDSEAADPVETDQEPALDIEPETVRERTSTVSDEALQMLVYKTNREHKRKQKVIWGGIALSSVIVLLMGGAYFYNGMVSDVEDMERKHRRVLQQVNAEVIKRKSSQLTEKLGIKEEPVTQLSGTANNQPVVKRAASTETDNSKSSDTSEARAAADKKKIRFVKSNKIDPVGVLLNDAWKSYNAGEYKNASTAYDKVLAREPDNRDALLGKAAIAVKQGQLSLARNTYQKLLRLDPNDSLAVSSLMNISRQNLSEMSESKLKLLLRQKPDDAYLNFALANTNAQQSRWPAAQKYYFNAWQAEPDNADFAFNLAVSLEQIGKADQAAIFYKKSIELAASSNFSFPIATARQRLSSLSR